MNSPAAKCPVAASQNIVKLAKLVVFGRGRGAH